MAGGTFDDGYVVVEPSVSVRDCRQLGGVLPFAIHNKFILVVARG